MKKRAGRRTFLKQISISGITAGVAPATLLATPIKAKPEKQDSTKEKGGRQYNGSYEGEYLNRVAFPIGGLGAGMFCLEGTGAISHMSVRNHPEIFNEPALFAAIAVKGLTNGVKVLEGQVPDWKMFGQRGTGNGAAGTTYGLPRFQNAEFTTKFPFGTIQLQDADIPL